MTPEQMLREFHASKRIHAGLMPAEPTAQAPDWIRALRWRLLSEELEELGEADRDRDVVKMADAIADIVYVLVGTAVVHGIPFDAVFAEVHRSNMTKTNTPDEAKLVKGPQYEPPRIAELLACVSHYWIQDPKYRGDGLMCGICGALSGSRGDDKERSEEKP